MTTPASLPARRQVHLDFHTSPFIDGVGADFDPDQFADTYARAHVDSVTVFAKCHHGMCYYPTRVGTRHPTLARPDLLGEMIEALHRRGIRAPIYTTVAWEEDVAQRHPEWRQVRADGTFAQLGNSADGKTVQPGRWRFNNFLHPDYQDYIEAHVRELLDMYPVDGLFFDILFLDRGACWSSPSVKFREAHGALADDDDTFARFETAAQVQFAERFTRLIHGRHPKATAFYNMPARLDVDATVGVAASAKWRTHWEIESLPSGFWGYYHFPRLARRAAATGEPWLGMTGRFQKMWGDFGGLKPQPALEFERFRTQALGGGNSVGDQLHPRGGTDGATYSLIGAVYAQCKDAEPFYAGTIAKPQVGILIPNGAGAPGHDAELSLEGAVQLCEEAHYDSVVLDGRADFSGLGLLILPDHTRVSPALAGKIGRFVVDGGRLVSSYRGGFGPDGAWGLAPAIQLAFDAGDEPKFPTYWRGRPEFSGALIGGDRVMYSSGLRLREWPGATVHVDRVLPYFRRTDLEFCSHFQTPPRPDIDAAHPAVVGTDRWTYFADPIFGEYRKTGNQAAREAWRTAMERLIGPAQVGHGLPGTVLAYPRMRGSELRLTLLHYVPVRKALEIDVIDERMGFAGEKLKLPAQFREARAFGETRLLGRDDGGNFVLPAAKGRLLIEASAGF